MKKIGNRWLAWLLLATMLLSLLVGCNTQESPTVLDETEGRETVSQREPVPQSTRPSVPAPTEPSTAVPTEPPVTPPTTPPTQPDRPTEPENEALTDGKYPPIDPDVMPIGAWVSPPRANISNRGNPSFITDEQFKTLSESGINLIYGLYEIAYDHLPEIMDTLDYCEKYGLKYLIRDFSVNEADMDIVRNALRRYAKHLRLPRVRR